MQNINRRNFEQARLNRKDLEKLAKQVFPILLMWLYMRGSEVFCLSVRFCSTYVHIFNGTSPLYLSPLLSFLLICLSLYLFTFACFFLYPFPYTFPSFLQLTGFFVIFVKSNGFATLCMSIKSSWPYSKWFRLP